MRRSTIVTAAVISGLTLVGACSGGGSGPVAERASAPIDTAGGEAGEIPLTTEVARPTAPVDVFDQPSDTATRVTTLASRTDLGSARALLVVERRGGWAKVLLPVRPNGSTGWIRIEGVEVRTIDEAIVVDLDAKTLSFFEGGEAVIETTIAVGAPEWPTPRGRFFVADFLESPDPAGPYGPYAYGLSGHSDTLTEFAGGDGRVGIHGTNDPSSIGRAVSHGCIRVPNEVIRRLAERTPLGTPVVVM